MDIDLRIKELVEKQRKTQDEFANAIGVSSKVAHYILNGKTKIEAHQLPLIANFLKVPIKYFYEDIDLNNVLKEPEFVFEKTDCELCKSKDKTIAALEENIVLLKGQIEFLKKQA